MATSLAADEILVEVRLRVVPAGAGCAIEEFARRHGDFAIAAIAVVIVRDGQRCAKARIATAGISSHSVRLKDAEKILERQGLGDSAIAQAAKIAAESVEPMADGHASVGYRRQLTQALTERAVKRAAGR